MLSKNKKFANKIRVIIFNPINEKLVDACQYLIICVQNLFK